MLHQFPSTSAYEVAMEDELIHSDENPYCNDPTCPCTDQAVADGVLTEDEAANLAFDARYGDAR